MKLKKAIKFLGCSLAGFIGAGTIALAGTAPEILDINLQKDCPTIEGVPKDKKVVPGFSHKAHAVAYLKGNEKYAIHPYTDEFTCSACHIGAKDRASLNKESVCKGLEAAFEASGGTKKFQNYFHKTCKGCHKAMKKDGLKTGPVSCKGCHGKK